MFKSKLSIIKLDFDGFKRMYQVFKHNRKVLVCNTNTNYNQYKLFVKTHIKKRERYYVLDTKPTIYVFQSFLQKNVFLVHYNEFRRVFEIEALVYL